MQSATTQKWTGRWEQASGKAKEIWGWLTSDDLTQMKGNYEQLVGRIHEKTGESREEIERRLHEACKECES